MFTLNGLMRSCDARAVLGVYLWDVHESISLVAALGPLLRKPAERKTTARAIQS
jgi:hypothetical protein